MMQFISRLLCLGLLLSLPSWVCAEPLPKSEVAKLTKPATVLIDANPVFGSGFCVQEAGFFVTNAHVIENVAANGTVKVVLNAGEVKQKVVKAKVVRKNTTLDLALLKAEGIDTYPIVQLGSTEKLGELDELIVCGFPFGQALSKTDDYPSITVNAVTVSSLRRDKDRELNRIQMDGSVNPGVSGGPVMDRKGQVIGVVISGIRGSGLFMAIPVSHVRKFLEQPEIVLTMPDVTVHDKSTVKEFRASVLSLPVSKEPYDVALTIKSNNKERKFDMKLEGGSYIAKAAPFEAEKTFLKAEVVFPEGTISVPIAEQNVKLLNKEILLSQIKSIRLGASPLTTLLDGKVEATGIAELQTLSVTLGGQVIKIPTAGAKEINIQPGSSTAGTYHISVIASRAGKEVARAELLSYLDGIDRPGTASLLKGKFVKPPRASQPTTYMHIVSTAGDYIGQGKTYKYDANKLKVSGGGASVSVNLLGEVGDFNLDVVAPNGQVLAVGEYLDARRFPFNNEKPGLNFSGRGRGSNQLTGKFVVWELESDKGVLTKAAIDFVQFSENNTKSPLVGVLRFNSSLE